MSKILNHGEYLKSQYMDITIPDTLDHVISQGISSGRQGIRRQIIQRWTTSAALILLTIMISFTASINLSSAFAESLANVPILKHIVRVLRFVDDEASGGQITDGTNIEEMEVVASGEIERFIIHFNQEGNPVDGVNAYKLHKFNQPNVIQFDIGGARMISASDDFEHMRKLTYVKDVYRLMTLDDSLIRFQLLLEEGIGAEIAEIKSPTGMLVTLSKIETSSQDKRAFYIVRSKSYPLSESFGHLEEDLFWVNPEDLPFGYRIIKDAEGSFLYELGCFESESEAKFFLEGLEHQLTFELLIEFRQGNELPKVY